MFLFNKKNKRLGQMERNWEKKKVFLYRNFRGNSQMCHDIRTHTHTCIRARARVIVYGGSLFIYLFLHSLSVWCFYFHFARRQWPLRKSMHQKLDISTNIHFAFNKSLLIISRGIKGAGLIRVKELSFIFGEEVIN